MSQHQVTEIKLLQKQKQVDVAFDNDEQFCLSCEYLRVNSPSAEVQGHGSEPKKILTDKQDVNIIAIEPVGNYAVKIVFDDGHQSGIYSWDTLYELGKKQDTK